MRAARAEGDRASRRRSVRVEVAVGIAGLLAGALVPHERLGEAVCAFIVPRDPAAPPNPDELAEFMLDQDIAKAKVPAEWHIIGALPTTASGKVQKHLLLTRRSDG